MCPHDQPIDTYCIKCPNGIAQGLNAEHFSYLDLTDVSFATRTEDCSRCEDPVKAGFYMSLSPHNYTLYFICKLCAAELNTEAGELSEEAERRALEHENLVLREYGGYN